MLLSVIIMFACDGRNQEIGNSINHVNTSILNKVLSVVSSTTNVIAKFSNISSLSGFLTLHNVTKFYHFIHQNKFIKVLKVPVFPINASYFIWAHIL